MQQALSTLDRIAAIKAQIESLEKSAINELRGNRDALISEIAQVDADIALLTGEKIEKKTRRTARLRESEGKQISFELLKTMLRRVPSKTINIRKEGFDTKQVRSLAAAYPQSLTIEGNGPWPTVTLLSGLAD